MTILIVDSFLYIALTLAPYVKIIYFFKETSNYYEGASLQFCIRMTSQIDLLIAVVEYINEVHVLVFVAE